MKFKIKSIKFPHRNKSPAEYFFNIALYSQIKYIIYSITFHRKPKMKNNHGFSNILIISIILILGFGGYFIYTYYDFNFLTKQNFENPKESQKNTLKTNNLKNAAVNTTELKLYINQKEGYSFSYPSTYKISEFDFGKLIFKEKQPQDPFEAPFGISFNIQDQIPVNEFFPESVFTKQIIGNREVYVGEIVPSRFRNINYLLPIKDKFLSLFISPFYEPEIIDQDYPNQDNSEAIKENRELKETAEIVLKTFTLLENYNNEK